MKTVPILVLSSALPLAAQSYWGRSGDVELEFRADTPWAGQLIVNNDSLEELIFSTSSNPAPWVAGYSISGDNVVSASETNASLLVYYWGEVKNLVFLWNSEQVSLSTERPSAPAPTPTPVAKVPEPFTTGPVFALTMVTLFSVFRKRRH